MTYISRGTRLISSRWLDECDAEYKLRASRKRSDGRLKRHSSCDDLRAWNICEWMNYSYLLDLMSDGESVGRGRVRLYGRYIPVPLLLKILKNFNEETAEQRSKENQIANDESGRSTGKRQQYSSSKNGRNESTTESGNKSEEGSGIYSYQMDSRGSKQDNLLKIQCEKYLLERRFSKCSSLLCKAVRKLEKIDGIVCEHQINSENTRNEEIEMAFRRAKSVCNCSTSGSQSRTNSTSEPNLEKGVKDISRCSELLRKISDLKLNLKDIGEERQRINERIRQKQAEKCRSGQQVTELYNRWEEVELKRLLKKLEKLMSRKGQILSELTKTIKLLNKFKKAPMRSKLNSSADSKSRLEEEDFQYNLPVACVCGCQCTDHLESSNSHVSEDVSQDDCSEKTRLTNGNYIFSPQNVSKKTEKYNVEAKGLNNESAENWQSKRELNKNNGRSNNKYFSESPKTKPGMDFPENKNHRDKADRHREEYPTKLEKKSKLKFVCPEPPCRNNSISENFQNLQNVYLAQQQRETPQRWLNKNQVLKNVDNPRPYTSPSTTSNSLRSEIPERRIKSETTMEEIEKTLRNYEKRLRKVDSLEFKIMRMKQKELERSTQREEWLTKIKKLCSENWALKKKVRELQTQSDIQMKKMHTLCAKKKKKFMEMECEAQELKKELIKFQGSFEGQKNRIRMLENCVVNQRTEIEKLTSLINNRNAAAPTKCCEEKSAQKSRSYSPESLRTTKTFSQSNSQARSSKFSQFSEDDDSCCCEGGRQYNSMMKSQPTTSVSGQPTCPPHGIRKRGRCVF